MFVILVSSCNNVCIWVPHPTLCLSVVKMPAYMQQFCKINQKNPSHVRANFKIQLNFLPIKTSFKPLFLSASSSLCHLFTAAKNRKNFSNYFIVIKHPCLLLVNKETKTLFAILLMPRGDVSITPLPSLLTPTQPNLTTAHTYSIFKDNLGFEIMQP